METSFIISSMRYSTAILIAGITGTTAALARAGVRQPGKQLPGDRLVRRAVLTRTIACDIPSPPSAVWPWLAQMGAGRAGWYAFDRIDNGGVPSASEVIPALQRIVPGDTLASSAGGAPPFVVTQAVPGRALVTVLRSRGGHLRVSYAYVLEPTGSGGTRLTARLRMGGRPLLPSLLAAPVVLAAHEAGQRRQFARLRRRISALPAPHR
jgi:hypothetical protein